MIDIIEPLSQPTAYCPAKARDFRVASSVAR